MVKTTVETMDIHRKLLPN